MNKPHTQASFAVEKSEESHTLPGNHKDTAKAVPEVYYKNSEGAVGKVDRTNLENWLREARLGKPQAQYNLGLMYSRGEGVPRSDQEAVKWYRLSAEQRIPGAQSNLGLMYEKGLGVEQDYVEAHKWFNIAGVNGNAVGKKNANIIEKKMAPGQIIVAIGLARKWMEKI